MPDKKRLAKTLATHGLAALGGVAVGEKMARKTDPLFSLLTFFYKVIDMELKAKLLTKPEWSPIFNALLSSAPDRDLVGFWMLELAQRVIAGEKLDDILQEQVKWPHVQLREHVSQFVVEHFRVVDDAVAETIADSFPDVNVQWERKAEAHHQRIQFARQNLPELIRGLKDERAKKALQARLRGKQPERVFEFLVGACGIEGQNPQDVLTRYGLLGDDDFYQSVDFVLR